MIYREFTIPAATPRQVQLVILGAWEYVQSEEQWRSGQSIECHVTEAEGFGVCFEIGIPPDPMLVVGACQLGTSGVTVAMGLIDETRSALANDVEDILDNFPGKVSYHPPSRPLPLWMLVLDAPGAKQYRHGTPQGDPAPAEPHSSPEPGREDDAGETTNIRTELGLTARQMEVADLIADGLSESEIGEKLVIVATTVNKHSEAISERIKQAKNIDGKLERQAKIDILREYGFGTQSTV